ncbi:putative T7SS-secreted protein [Nocardioides dongkuii]|uniref:putative T7SS-secreted protein n=1 Tax=Nocardioides dongkuii TaxID=2760089 RepID=UPI0015F7CF1C|nr:hypothetical protein [Nocardioides dongkuii]
MSLPPGGELGSTSDPKKLILGDPAHVDAIATALATEARRVRGLATTVGAITTPGWEGGLAQPAYAGAFAREQEKWGAYTTLLEKAGSTLRTYAGSLRTAQSSAADAIAKWEEGEQATQEAVAAHNAAVKAYEDAVCRPAPVQSPFAPPSAAPSVSPARPGPFQDPGEAIREEAVQILEDAREKLDEAGVTTLEALGALEGSRTEGSDDVFGADGSAEGPSISWPLWEQTFGHDPATGKDGKYKDTHDSPFEISLGKAEGEVYVYQAKGEYEDYFGGLKVNADGSFTAAGADGSAEAVIDKDGVRINADGTLTLLNAQGEVTGEYGLAEGSLGGEVSVEATASGHLTADATGVHAGGEAFAGAKASANGSVDLGGVGAGVEAEAWAGAGIAGDLDVGFDDGILKLGGSGGIAWGVGGKIGGEIELDFPEIAENTGDLIASLGDVLP